MVICSQGDGSPGISRLHDGGVRIGTQKESPFREEFPSGKPEMEGAVQIKGCGYHNPPDARGWLLKPDKNQLASVGKVGNLIINADGGFFQQEGYHMIVGGGSRKRADDLACGRDKADGIDFNVLGPEFHGKSLLLFGYGNFDHMGSGGLLHDAAVMMPHSGFVAGGSNDGCSGRH